MEIVATNFVLAVLAGVGLAIYEARKGVTFRDEGLRDTRQTEADRERIRGEDSFTHRNW